VADPLGQDTEVHGAGTQREGLAIAHLDVRNRRAIWPKAG
jgi:hypothetical protein